MRPYSYLLYRTGLVSKPLATRGLLAWPLIFTAGVLVLFDIVPAVSLVGVGLVLPISLHKMALATWLVWRGFDRSAASSLRPTVPERPAAIEQTPAVTIVAGVHPRQRQTTTSTPTPLAGGRSTTAFL